MSLNLTVMPAMTSTVTPPTTTAYPSAPAYAAPTMTSMYASAANMSMYLPANAATTAYAAPATTTVAASTLPTTTAVTASSLPTTTVAATTLPTTTAVAVPVAAPLPSFTPPMGVASPTVPTWNGAPEPVKLTAGLPAPSQIEAERQAYERALQAQLDKQSKAVMEEAKIKQAMLKQTAIQQKEQMTLQIDERTQIECLRVEQEAIQLVSGLKEAAITQQTMQEEKAAIAVADFNKKRAMEEMTAQTWSIQQQWYQKESTLQAEYNQVMQRGSKAVSTPQLPTLPPVASPLLSPTLRARPTVTSPVLPSVL